MRRTAQVILTLILILGAVQVFAEEMTAGQMVTSAGPLPFTIFFGRNLE